jgi:hypothetical protein
MKTKTTHIMIVAVLAMSSVAAAGSSVVEQREAACQGQFTAGTHPHSESAARNADRCVIRGDIADVPVGERVAVERGEATPVGEPVEVDRETGEWIRVNNPRAAQGVYHRTTTVLFEQATEVEVTYEQQTEQQQEVRTYDFHPQTNELRSQGTTTETLGAGKPIRTTETEAGTPIESTETSSEVDNPGKRR